ncbi:MAG: hypothetical protein ACR2PI_20795 [Hyphomicrobiaceae bacterium]
MTAQPAPSNHPVFLLAEHLDMILAAIEDLQACRPSLIPGNPQRVGAPPQVSLARYVEELKGHEMAAIMRVLRARDLTRELVRRDNRFATLGGLFVGGTAALDEAVQRMVDKTGNAFTTGGDPIGYLRARGMVDEEAGGIGPNQSLKGTEAFKLAGSIEMGPLIELVETFLNTIELHFDLFPDLSEPEDHIHDGGELVN